MHRSSPYRARFGGNPPRKKSQVPSGQAETRRVIVSARVDHRSLWILRRERRRLRFRRQPVPKPVGQIDCLGTFHPRRRPLREFAARSPGPLRLSSLPQFVSPEPQRGRIRRTGRWRFQRSQLPLIIRFAPISGRPSGTPIGRPVPESSFADRAPPASRRRSRSGSPRSRRAGCAPPHSGRSRGSPRRGRPSWARR